MRRIPVPMWEGEEMFIDSENNLIVTKEDCEGGILWHNIREYLSEHCWGDLESGNLPKKHIKEIIVPRITHFYGIPVHDSGGKLGGVVMKI